ncbi:TrkA-N domain-containing protein [Sinosporangium album]|uniref:TrkA-N domain-containing protein n=1 Tax=Sinosporangium album TaxID=504805 RepID=A0A1G7RAF5_9ACTN|nr:NAD-binding protein [Sinosporangium album]SDG07776.1 TrkA-N domain-containing protein [Sinosporangium album]
MSSRVTLLAGAGLRSGEASGMSRRSLTGDGERMAISVSSTLRFVFVFLTGLSLLLGFWGMRAHLGGEASFLDLIYFTLQLFVLDPAPLGDSNASLPWQLELARFTAPAVTVSTLVTGVYLLISAELLRMRARRSHGHAVVCGSGPMAITLTERMRMRTQGDRVVVISPNAATYANDRGLLHVAGDARNPAVLRAAGVQQARVL